MVERAREKALKRRERLKKKLKVVLKTLSEKRKFETEQVSNESRSRSDRLKAIQALEAKKIAEKASLMIAALPPIPKGVSKEIRIELADKRREDIAKIRGDAITERKALSDAVITERTSISNDTKSKRADLSNRASKEQDDEREAADEEREDVSNELKATVNNARANYDSLKERVRVKYGN